MRTKRLCICIVLVMSGISFAQEPATPDPNALLGSCNTARAAGDLLRADTLALRGVKQYPRHRGLWLALIDTALARGNPTAALERASQAEQSLGADPELAWRRGQAYAVMGRWVGATQRRKLPDAKLGQFIDGRLVVKRLDRWGTVLLSGEDSAIHATRMALEGGLDRPAVHLLYARCWINLGATEVAVAIVRRQLERLTEADDGPLLEQAKSLACDAGELALLLDVAKIQAGRAGKNAPQILAQAHDQAADIAALRGDIKLTYSLRKRAYELQPEVEGRRLRLADAAWDAGDRDVAVAHYRAILAADPHLPQHRRLEERLRQATSPK